MGWRSNFEVIIITQSLNYFNGGHYMLTHHWLCKKHTSRSYGAQQKYNHMHSLYPQGHFCLWNTNDYKKQNLLNTLRGVYNFLLKSGARGVDLQWKDQNDFIEKMPFGCAQLAQNTIAHVKIIFWLFCSWPLKLGFHTFI